MMPMLKTQQVEVLVEVLDAEGYSLGQEVPVELTVTYGCERYGEDADGNRGEWRRVFEVTDAAIDPAHLRPLNSLQVEQILKDAETAVLNDPDRYMEDHDEEQERQERTSAYAEWKADSALRGEVEDL